MPYKTKFYIPIPLVIIWGVLCLFFCILWIEDIYQVLNNTKAYPIGAESCGFWYRTLYHYIVFDSILILWNLLGIIFCLWSKKKYANWCLLIHIIFTLLYLFIIVPNIIE